MAILVQVRPPLLVWNRYGANTNPAFAVAKATSVTPGRSGSPMRAIGAATLPRRCQVLPPSVLISVAHHRTGPTAQSFPLTCY
jgi:hypothetical protein